MESKPNQRVMLTKELIHRALIELLKHQDIHKISIRELCGIAGINRTTFYNHYGSQYDVLSEMEQVFLDNITSFLSHEPSRCQNPLEDVLRYLESNIALVRLLINSNVDPEFPMKLFSLDPIQQTLRGFSSDEISAQEQEYSMNLILYGGFQIVKIWVNKDSDREDPKWMAALLEKLLSQSKV